MAVVSCKQCDTTYWRYRRDHPPKGFCSISCRDGWDGDHPKHVAQPDHPRVVLQRIKEHNRLMHNADSEMIEWECKACERLQTEYAESLAFHVRFAPEVA